jgi:urate oxidase
MKLSHSQYGKSAVGLLKVFREGDVHTVKEIEVSALATGDFECAFLAGDNRTTVPTDTIKNTIYALAHEHLAQDGIEAFGQKLAAHYLHKYPSFDGITIDLLEKPWGRMDMSGVAHPHAFQRTGDGISTATVKADRTGLMEVTSGLRDLEILKSTGSGFVGFPKCDYTTLPEVTDRIMATKVSGSWHYTAEPADYAASNAKVRAAFLDVFANRYSRAVQETLFQMATEALNAVPEIDTVSLRLPNVHYFGYNLEPFGLPNDNVIFYPSPHPHGNIAATVCR